MIADEITESDLSLLQPLANILQMPLDVISHTMVKGARTVSLKIADDLSLTITPDVKVGWLRPSAKYAMLLTRIKGQVYAFMSHDGALDKTHLHLFNRAKFQDTNIASVVKPGMLLSQAATVLKPTIFASYMRKGTGEWTSVPKGQWE